LAWILFARGSWSTALLGGCAPKPRAWATIEPSGAAGAAADEVALRSAGPDPLDLPTGEQGMALAALDSGRWTVEAGSHALEGSCRCGGRISSGGE